MRIGNPETRLYITKARRQFVLIPTFGIVWSLGKYRFGIAFMWFNLQARVAFGKG